LRRPLLYAAAALAAAAGVLFFLRAGRPSSRGAERRAGPRIVSLAPNVTEMVFLLGLGDALVGVTDACNHPPAAKRVPVVGNFGRPNVEVLLAARPDLVVTSGLRPGPATDAMHNAGVRILDLEMHSFDDLFAGLRRLGAAAGAPEKGEAAAARLAADLENVSGRYATLPAARRPRVFVEIGEAPLTTAGGPSFMDEVIRRAGGVNVAHELAKAYVRVNPEMVVAWDPDVVLLGRMAPHGDARTMLAGRIGWGKIAAVQNDRVIGDIHPDLLLRPGPRLVEGVKALAARLHPPHQTRHGAGQAPEGKAERREAGAR